MAVAEAFLAPLSDGSASGVDLRNDARFHAIERLLEPASRAVRTADGSSGSAAVDWPSVLEGASDLAGSGRDLRLLVIAVRAMYATEGFAGLAEGLNLLTDTLRQFWDSVHPVLRDSPSPREAATRRINALFQLENNDNGLLCDIDLSPVFTLRGLGPITGGDLSAGALAVGAMLSEAAQGLGERERAALVESHEARVNRVRAATRALSAEDPARMGAVTDGLAAARTALSGLEAALTERVADNGVGVKFEALGKLFGRIGQTLSAAAPLDSLADEVQMPPDPYMNGADTAQTPAAAAAPAAAPTAGGIPGRVNSRRDVEVCLDMIIDFYERTEPSSPIPHLARRMRKMVPMNFMQLMEEIAPSGMKEFRNVAGVVEK
jgi:type VI secretion system protein ImpA